MKTKIILFSFIMAIIIAIMSCDSRSGQLTEMKMREAQVRVIKKQHEIKHGVSVMNVMYSKDIYKTLDDSVALRMTDNVYFVKRKDKILGDWRYFRVE